jgi:hypothetical protein
VSDDEWHTTSRKLPPRDPEERPCESLPYRGLNRDNHQRVVDDRPSVRVEADVEASYRELTGLRRLDLALVELAAGTRGVGRRRWVAGCLPLRARLVLLGLHLGGRDRQ